MLSPKQEKFCEYIVSGKSGKESYISAYETKCSDQVAYNEASKLLLREDIQKRLAEIRKPLEKAIQVEVMTEREKKKKIIWEGIEKCRISGDHNGVARYMDILNKMDAEYININRNIEDSASNIKELDNDALI